VDGPAALKRISIDTSKHVFALPGVDERGGVSALAERRLNRAGAGS